MDKLLKKSGKEILLGNEAIVRAALEAGVEFIATYPGTPASEIGDTFSKIHTSPSLISKINKFYFEYSINEKAALEAGIGASFAGLKTLVAMKNFGVNVALDALLPFSYTGTNGATVIVVADDPSCHSSAQSEQNSRAFAYLTHLPLLEPSSPQECKDFTATAFRLSEKYKVPVILHTTTRVAHQSAPVRLKTLEPRPSSYPLNFSKNSKHYLTIPPRVLEMKKELLAKIEKIQKEVAEKSSVNKLFKTQTSSQKDGRAKTKIGIVASGVSFLYAKEALEELNLNLPILKIGLFYPLATKKISNFIKDLEKVLVVEELEPYLEKEITALAKEANPKLQIFGKNLLSQVGELKSEHLITALAQISGKKIPPYFLSKPNPASPVWHIPRFCDGCPYWQVFSAIKKAAPKNTIFGGDIGCYMMAAFAPHHLFDYLLCMGSSISIGHGLKKSTKNKVVAFVGDSTFFHSGLSGLINAVYNQSDILVIILENKITAMTGHQPHPGVSAPEKQEIKIENIVRALGIKNVRVIDPKTDFSNFVKTAHEFLNKKGVSVIIARHPCWLFYEKRK